jgi:hypothetical protein
VSEPAIKGHFGHDIFKEVAGESLDILKATPVEDSGNQPAH